MPSEPAKNAKTCVTKCFSESVSFAQSSPSLTKEISSGVQNDATDFLYMSYRCCSEGLMGNNVKDMAALYSIHRKDLNDIQ
jgi:hypothetical protein